MPIHDESIEKGPTRKIIDDMPTPTDAGGAIALFAALELESMEQGQSTPEESGRVLREVFAPRPEQD